MEPRDRLVTRLQRHPLLVLALVALVSGTVASCGPSAAELAAVDYAPTTEDDWSVSTPEEQGLDPRLVARLYHEAADVESIRGLLVVKGGKLIGEDYFNGGAIERMDNRHSVTKSYTSALVGLALEQGCLSSVDQRMIEFFPELADQIQDPRKEQITLRQMLQMRAGYPWEESAPALLELLFAGFRPSNLVDVSLAYDPGTDMWYSNLTSHLLGVIVARACDTDLKSFAEEHLFAPLDTEVGFWQTDWEGNYLGHSDLHLRARDMAKFGLMVLDDGVFQGKQILPAEWVQDSLQTYSEDAWRFRVGRNWKDSGYGYQWWSVRAGDHRYNMAWGHGGAQIALVEDLDLVIVVTTDPLHLQHGDQPWNLEKENLNLVADFVARLPSE